MKNILVVGLGLIGGSIAKSLKRNTSYRILGIDVCEDVLLDALSMGVIDAKADAESIHEADVVYLCTYPAEAVEFVKRHQSHFKDGCIITDTSGIKTYICEQINRIQGSFIFVGAHPMAGKEKSGFSASDPSIFMGASYIITPCNASQAAVDTISNLANKMGFGKIVITTPEEHDCMIAFTSQVPHVLACAYVLSPACEFHQGFSAGSYRDVSRVADINTDLWANLFLENKTALISELDILINHIKGIRDSISDSDEYRLRSYLDTAASIKRRDFI